MMLNVWPEHYNIELLDSRDYMLGRHHVTVSVSTLYHSHP